MTEKIMFQEYLKPLEIYGVTFESVETGAQNPGFEDVVFFKEPSNGTIELKKLKNKIQPFVMPEWRQGQLPKLTLHRTRSKHVYLLLWVDNFFYLTNKIQKIYDRDYLRYSNEVHRWETTLTKDFVQIL